MKIRISEAIINEALTPSEFRPLMKIGRELAMERINQIWPRLEAQADSKNRSGDRLYFNLEKSEEEEIKTPSKDGIISYLNQASYEVVDFKEGLVRKKGDKNIVRLGKVLTMLSKIDPKAKYFLNVYNNEKSVLALDTPDDYVMVISRHPYDIGGISTDRVWKSCVNLRGTHENKEYIPIDIEKGTIVSYLLNKNDLNIKNPVARISIKPFINISDEKDVLYGIEQDSVKYGRQHEGYVKKLINVLDIAQKEKTGVFKKDENLHSDSERKFINKATEEDKVKLKSKIKELRGGLTIESIFESHYWLLRVDFQDAVLGELRGGKLVWYDGTWKGGTWYGGIWKRGAWYGGIWKSGIWEDGKWEDGKWEDGTWNGGTWNDGTWNDGAWNGGTWEGGTWEGGRWYGGRWYGGTWKRGTWYGGTWNGGTWEGGRWEGGRWETGLWVDGTWKSGTWNLGTWWDGLWYGGKWGTGTWEGGKIWNGSEYVESSQPPK